MLSESLTYSPVELGFGTSGLRGLASDMTDLECYINTVGFLDFLARSNMLRPQTKVALAGDLRPSTPRILKAVAQAITDSNHNVVYIGTIPLPAAAYYSLTREIPLAMVTGSHIPADRNGIKFYKPRSEVLKADEPLIKASVSFVRHRLYSESESDSIFKNDGGLKQPKALPPQTDATTEFLDRYASLFEQPLAKKQVIVYQHSSVAADLLVNLLQKLGAEARPVDKSVEFVPIDTENVTPANQAYFKKLAEKYPDNFAIVSADGDADRPFVVDENGTFQRGDILGAVTAEFLGAKTAAVPISASDALDIYLSDKGMKIVHTKIGSPYVIEAMESLAQAGGTPVVGWEVNGGFLTGSDIQVGSHSLTKLATRDAFLPIVCALVAAASKGIKVSELFKPLPARFTQAGLIDNFPLENSRLILEKYSQNTPDNYRRLEGFFSPDAGFSRITNINSLDGVRITFDSGDIAHIRPSGNAPQLRIYSVANSQARADEIVKLALDEPAGILRRLEKSVI